MNRKGFSTAWLLIVIVLVVAGAILAFTLMRNDGTEPVQDTVNETTNTVQENTEDDDLLSKIIDNPQQYYDQTVTVKGEIQDVQSRRVFKISDQTAGDELYVITRQPLTQEQIAEAEELFEDNADVSVTGTLQRFVLAEIERDYNFDLSAELEAEFQDKPVLIADSFTFSDNQAVFDFTQGPGADEQ